MSNIPYCRVAIHNDGKEVYFYPDSKHEFKHVLKYNGTFLSQDVFNFINNYERKHGVDFKVSIEESREIWNELMVLGFKEESFDFSKTTFVFTGFRDRDAETKLQKVGATISEKYTPSMTHLIMKQSGSGTQKEKQAVKNGSIIMNKEQFYEFLKRYKVS